ncbi:MAG: neutral/alkaline non-lysosomal ceramidase N-terminal domain-containing protein [Planctomycetota bacterium]|nr:neutral/alkaline non-lysosomal ceramidase N-terminal domain-containing protein [Planctomycetota bacterium]
MNLLVLVTFDVWKHLFVATESPKLAWTSPLPSNDPLVFEWSDTMWVRNNRDVHGTFPGRSGTYSPAHVLLATHTMLYQRPEGDHQLFVGWCEGNISDTVPEDSDHYDRNTGYDSVADLRKRLSELLPVMAIEMISTSRNQLRTNWRTLCLGACLLAIGPICSADDSYAWRAGVSKTVITPDTSVWLAGYGSRRPPEGTLHDLWMKALALEDPQGHRVVLVTSDFQGIPKSMSDKVFARLQSELRLERHQVMLTFSHNHCGPRLGDDLVDYYPIDAQQVAMVDEYTQAMQDRMVRLIGQAIDQLAPASLAVGQGVAKFAVNRRNNREADVPTILAQGKLLAGPVDHTVPVLQVRRRSGEVVAILFGYACHPTTLSFNQWCGDYPGFAQLEIEAKHPGAAAMFVNTCGGDQNPLPRRSVELCANYGHQLAVAVQMTLAKPLQPLPAEIRTAFEYVELPYLEVINRESLHTALQDGNEIRGRWAARMLQQLDEGKVFPSSYPYPVHAWRLGNITMLGLGAETVVDYALRFKRELGESTWVCGYTDDMIAYIPSRRVWEEGGYEGGSNLYEYGRPALRWSGEIEDKISASVHRLADLVGRR